MSRAKQGFFRRIFTWIGNLFRFLRWTINALFLILLVVALFSLFGKEVKPLPEHAALRLVPSGALVEERTYSDPLTQLMEQNAPEDVETPVHDLIATLDHAATDKRITGLILDLNYLSGGGISKLLEVGKAIDRFRESGKPVVAIADNYQQEQYFLASYADEIILNPMGGVLITGYGYYGTFFKEAADKLKINFHIFRAGEYKSAVEPFTRNDMSTAARDNAKGWLDELWMAYTSAVESRRQLASGTLNRLANELPILLANQGGDLSALAMKLGLVDKLATRPQLISDLGQRFGADENGGIGIHHKDYLSHLRQPLLERTSKEEQSIGVIIASGAIVDGEQQAGAIGGDSLSQLLREVRKDTSLKGLVLRIDSPGGSAYAAELIRQELLETRKQMPVVISMGSLAASGGYWIAAGASEIWAQPTTLTGSIGVFGIVPTFEDSLEALGIHSDGVGTTKLADLYHLNRPLSADAGALLQLGVDHIYRRFLELVAEGRQSTPEAIDKVARGQVWTGRQAKDLGLVDELGGLDQAIKAAGSLAGLKHWRVQYLTRPLSFQEQLLKQLADSAAPMSHLLAKIPSIHDLPGPVGQSLHRGLAQLSALNDPQGIYLQCFDCP